MKKKATLFTLFDIASLNARIVEGDGDSYVEIYASLPMGSLEKHKARLLHSKLPKRPFLKKGHRK